MSKNLSDKEILEVLRQYSDSEESLFSDDSERDCFQGVNFDDENEVTSGEDNCSDEEGTNEPPKKKSKQEFSWVSGEFIPTVFDFDNTNVGVTDYLQLSDNVTELEIFLKHFDADLLQMIVDETNRYFEQSISKLPTSKKLTKWKPIDQEELLVFFALCMLMSQTKKHTIESYWSQDPLIATPVFSKFMSLDRFKLILRFLHFNDNLDNPEDKDHKIRPIIDHLNDIFGKVMSPFQNLCIDESLVLFKGRLSFKQYIPNKRHRFGIKLFLLCDCETGYVLKVILYLGAQSRILQIPNADLGKSGEVVMELMEEYLGKGHSLYVDNWYTSPNLFKALHDLQTNCCGTVKLNRKGLEKRIEKLMKGERVAKHSDNIMHLTWMDKKAVNILTTMHKDELVKSKQDRKTKLWREKPVSVQEYNNNMGSVDRSDMMLSFTESARKSRKWYKKLFFHLMDIVVLNSLAVWQVVTGGQASLGKFQLNLCRQILEKYGQKYPSNWRQEISDQSVYCLLKK